MAVFLRWMIRIVSVALALSVAAVLVAYWVFSRSIPDYDADWSVPGIGARVDIVRSNANVPHIYGENDQDVYYGLGFVHAQDRLWQMLMMRRTVQGRLSELFGERTLRIYTLMRRLDLYGLASRSVAAQDRETLAMLEAYSAGVNAWLELVAEEALGRGAPELLLFSPEIAPWRPADSIAILNLMALQLTGQQEAEVLRARASGAERSGTAGRYPARSGRRGGGGIARICGAFPKRAALCRQYRDPAARPALSRRRAGHFRGVECLGGGGQPVGHGCEPAGQ